MSRTKNALKMVSGSVANQLMIVIAGLILPPLIISNYGSAVNGLVNSVKQILSYFTIATVGLGAAGQIALYEPLAKKNQKKINLIMSELSNYLNKLSFFFFGFILLLAIVLPFVRKDELNFLTIFSVVIICGLGSIIEFKVLQKYKILLQADQKQYISSKVNCQGILYNIFFSVLLIYAKAPIILVQLVATSAYVVRMLSMRKKIKGIYPDLYLKSICNTKTIPKQKEALMYKMSDIINNYTPMTVVTIIFSFSDASVYSVYNTIFLSVGMIVSVFSSGFASSFGNIIVDNDIKRFKESYMGYSFIYRTMLMWLYTCAAVLIIPFVSLYINNSDGINYIIPSIGFLFSLNGILKNIRVPSTTIVDSVGGYEKSRIYMNYLEVIINIILSVILSIKIGLIGVLVAGTISSLIRSIVFICDIQKNVIQKSYIKTLFLILINFIVFLVIYVVYREITVGTWFQWILKAIIISVISGVVFGLINVVLDHSSFRQFYKRIVYLFRGDKNEKNNILSN